MMTHEDRVAQIERHEWFHAIDFGNGLITPGRFSADTPPNWTLYGVFSILEQLDCQGCRCLDIGTFTGLLAFILALGGGQVTASDILYRSTFNVGRDILDLDLEYIHGLTIAQLKERFEGDQRFDIVTMPGVLYHTYDPLKAIADCRQMTRPGGLFIIETPVRHDSDEPIMFLNSACDTSGIPEPHTYWIPTVQAVKQMLRFSCFELLADTQTKNRHTFVGKAVRPSDISSPNRMLSLIHTGQSVTYPGYLDFSALEQEEPASPFASLKLSNIPSRICAETFTTDLPLQPRWKAA